MFNSPDATSNFQNQVYFQSEKQCRQHALYFHQARYNKPIRSPVRRVQIIWLIEQDYGCCQTTKFTICNSSQSEIVRQVEFNDFA